MASKLIIREAQNGQYEWRRADDAGRWLDEHYHVGDLQALIDAHKGADAMLVLSGQNVISVRADIDEKQKKLAAKLLPYELEDDIIAAVDSLHFASANFVNGGADVLYVKAESLQNSLQALSPHVDIYEVLPDYLCITCSVQGVAALLEDDILYLRVGTYAGFAVEMALAAPVLQALIAELRATKKAEEISLHLYAGSDEERQTLRGLFAAEDFVCNETEAGFWDIVEATPSAAAISLRRGKFGRQLPFQRWWIEWKRPAYAVAAAFVLAVCAQLGHYYSLKAQGKNILAQINQVYLQAVPNGRLGDPEGVLSSMLRGVGSSDGVPSNFVPLLDKFSIALKQQENVQLSSFSYNGGQQSMQVTLDFTDLAAVSRFRESLEKQGLSAESPSTSANGEGYQARMKISEANP